MDTRLGRDGSHKTDCALCQQLFKPFLTMCKRAPHLWSDEELLRQRAQQAEADLVLDNVLHESAVYAIAGLDRELMPVMPLPKRPFFLNIREILIHNELGNQRDRRNTKRQQRNRAVGSH